MILIMSPSDFMDLRELHLLDAKEPTDSTFVLLYDSLYNKKKINNISQKKVNITSDVMSKLVILVKPLSIKLFLK